MTRPAIILDCDPGHDDALAILTAGRHAELLGITTVSGNVPLELTTRNALLTCEVAGLDVPVHAGARRPLVAEPRHAHFIHGKSGLDGPELGEPTLAPSGSDAVRFIVDTAAAREGVWLVATGPLTNVALALHADPELPRRLAGIALMGGSASFGNVTPAAEFNILADPEAAHVVFSAPVRRVMAGLDLTHQFLIDAAATSRIRSLGTRVARFAAELLTFYGEAYARAFSGRAEGPLHDPCAVLAVTHPHLFERAERHVAIELRGEHTRGMTVVDRRGVRSDLAPNTEVLERIDAPAALALLLETLSSYP